MSTDSASDRGRIGFPAIVYRGMLKLYPAAFRRRYEEEMLEIFREEWSAAGDRGLGVKAEYLVRLFWDIVRTVPREWSADASRPMLLTFLAIALALVYFSASSTPLLLKVLGCAALTSGVGLSSLAFAARGWSLRLRLGEIGLVAGFLLASFVGLKTPRIAPVEGPLLPVTDPALTGSEIFRRMTETYRKAQSYADTGEMQRIYAAPFRRTEIRRFSTAFVRGDGFRFEFKEQFNRLDRWKDYEIWLEGAKVRRWWTIEPEVRTEKDLSFALGAAAGISGNASTHVPGLLFPALRTSMLGNPGNRVELLGKESVDGVEAFKLRFEIGKIVSYFVWIDTRSYLITRIRLNRALEWSPANRVDETIVYHPHLNEPVRPESLTFHPSTPTSWPLRLGQGDGLDGALLIALGVLVSAAGLDLLHRRALRGRRWRKREVWLVSMSQRMSAGTMGVIATSVGLLVGGIEFNEALWNLLLANFLMQAGASLYGMHRRTSGYARFATGA